MSDQKKWYFGSLKTTIRHLGELLNEYRGDAEADTPRFRALVYGLKAVIEGQRALKDEELEKRLDELEKSIWDKGQTQ